MANRTKKSAAPPRLTPAILLLVGATISLGGLAFAALTLRDRAATIEAAAQSQGQMVMLMEEQVRSAIDTDGVVLSRLEELVRRRGIGALTGSLPDQFALIAIMADAPAIQSLLILGPDGRLALSTHEPPKGDSGWRGDRDYFVQVAPPSLDRDFISPLIQGRMTNRFIFAVSRRVDDDDGHFLAVVQSSIDADYFVRLYRRLANDPDETFAVYKTDGTIVLRFPLPRAENVKAAGAGFISLAAAAPAGTYVSPSVIDGVERLHAYRTVPDKGLIVTSSLPVDSVLRGWRRRTWQNAALMSGALVVLLALARWTWVAARRAETANRHEIEANRSKSTFFASASHDLRQPMQAMRLFWTVIDSRADALGDPGLRQATAKLDTAMRAGEELLDSLLDVATLEAGSVIPRLQTVDLAEIVAAETESFGKLAETRNLRLKAVAVQAKVHTDPVLLRRILRNLMVNAIKFTEKGGVLVGCRRRDDHVLLQVWDSGKGIAESELAVIFDDFYQIDNPSRTRAEGLGLGLSVVSRTARLLGHPVRVRSRPGRGSVFEIELPVVAP